MLQLCACVGARVCVFAGRVFVDGRCDSGAYPTAPLRINKVAMIQQASIRFGYLLLLLLLYFPQHSEAFINLEI